MPEVCRAHVLRLNAVCPTVLGLFGLLRETQKNGPYLFAYLRVSLRPFVFYRVLVGAGLMQIKYESGDRLVYLTSKSPLHTRRGDLIAAYLPLSSLAGEGAGGGVNQRQFLKEHKELVESPFSGLFDHSRNVSTSGDGGAILPGLPDNS